MRIGRIVAALLVGLTLLATGAAAAVRIKVNLASQTMQVTTGSGETYVWPVSTARKGFVTPRGSYGVQRMEVMHRSHKYHNSPMPHSIFFSGGYAIHGTFETRALGRAASHGCVRLSPDHAEQLYEMVKAEGASISIVGGRAPDTELADGQSPQHHRHVAAAMRRRGAAEPGNPLSYAPLTPSFDDWTRDPDLNR